MPIGISYIMSRKKKHFFSVEQLEELITKYFTHIKGQSHTETRKVSAGKNKGDGIEIMVWDSEPEPPTISGLAFYLGLESSAELEKYEQRGWYAFPLKRARLKIEAEYEKKLHDSSSGAMYALKKMSGDEKVVEKSPVNETENLLRFEIVQSGPKLASSENEVIL